jgi:hypothetical protein
LLKIEGALAEQLHLTVPARPRQAASSRA